MLILGGGLIINVERIKSLHVKRQSPLLILGKLMIDVEDQQSAHEKVITSVCEKVITSVDPGGQ